MEYLKNPRKRAKDFPKIHDGSFQSSLGIQKEDNLTLVCPKDTAIGIMVIPALNYQAVIGEIDPKTNFIKVTKLSQLASLDIGYHFVNNELTENDLKCWRVISQQLKFLNVMFNNEQNKGAAFWESIRIDTRSLNQFLMWNIGKETYMFPRHHMLEEWQNDPSFSTGSHLDLPNCFFQQNLEHHKWPWICMCCNQLDDSDNTGETIEEDDPPIPEGSKPEEEPGPGDTQDPNQPTDPPAGGGGPGEGTEDPMEDDNGPIIWPPPYIRREPDDEQLDEVDVIDENGDKKPTKIVDFDFTDPTISETEDNTDIYPDITEHTPEPGQPGYGYSFPIVDDSVDWTETTGIEESPFDLRDDTKPYVRPETVYSPVEFTPEGVMTEIEGIVAQINSFRINDPTGSNVPLILNANITAAAQDVAAQWDRYHPAETPEDMHTADWREGLLNGQAPAYDAQRFGYQMTSWFGEVSQIGTFDNAATNYKQSQMHWDILKDPKYTDIGIGIVPSTEYPGQYNIVTMVGTGKVVNTDIPPIRNHKDYHFNPSGTGTRHPEPFVNVGETVRNILELQGQNGSLPPDSRVPPELQQYPTEQINRIRDQANGWPVSNVDTVWPTGPQDVILRDDIIPGTHEMLNIQQPSKAQWSHPSICHETANFEQHIVWPFNDEYLPASGEEFNVHGAETESTRKQRVMDERNFMLIYDMKYGKILPMPGPSAVPERYAGDPLPTAKEFAQFMYTIADNGQWVNMEDAFGQKFENKIDYIYYNTWAFNRQAGNMDGLLDPTTPVEDVVQSASTLAPAGYADFTEPGYIPLPNDLIPHPDPTIGRSYDELVDIYGRNAEVMSAPPKDTVHPDAFTNYTYDNNWPNLYGTTPLIPPDDWFTGYAFHPVQYIHTYAQTNHNLWRMDAKQYELYLLTHFEDNVSEYDTLWEFPSDFPKIQLQDYWMPNNIDTVVDSYVASVTRPAEFESDEAYALWINMLYYKQQSTPKTPYCLICPEEYPPMQIPMDITHEVQAPLELFVGSFNWIDTSTSGLIMTPMYPWDGMIQNHSVRMWTEGKLYKLNNISDPWATNESLFFHIAWDVFNNNKYMDWQQSNWAVWKTGISADFQTVLNSPVPSNWPGTEYQWRWWAHWVRYKDYMGVTYSNSGVQTRTSQNDNMRLALTDTLPLGRLSVTQAKTLYARFGGTHPIFPTEDSFLRAIYHHRDRTQLAIPDIKNDTVADWNSNWSQQDLDDLKLWWQTYETNVYYNNTTEQTITYWFDMEMPPYCMDMYQMLDWAKTQPDPRWTQQYPNDTDESTLGLALANLFWWQEPVYDTVQAYNDAGGDNNPLWDSPNKVRMEKMFSFLHEYYEDNVCKAGGTTTVYPYSATYIQTQNQEFLDLVNAERALEGAPPLVWSEHLTVAAVRHSYDMVDRQYFASKAPAPAPYGETYGERITNANWDPTMAAQVIAAGQPTPAKVFEAWNNSANTRGPLMNPTMKTIGFGRPESSLSPVYTRNYWTALVSPLDNTTGPTGAVPNIEEDSFTEGAVCDPNPMFPMRTKLVPQEPTPADEFFFNAPTKNDPSTNQAILVTATESPKNKCIRDGYLYEYKDTILLRFISTEECTISLLCTTNREHHYKEGTRWSTFETHNPCNRKPETVDKKRLQLKHHTTKAAKFLKAKRSFTPGH